MAINQPVEFAHPYLTVDVLVFTIKGDKLSLLLIRRSHDPFRGSFALPGAFVQIQEALEETVVRVLKEKARQENIYSEQLFTFGKIDRDPRGRVVSVVYYALVPQGEASDVDDGIHLVKWFPADNLPPLAFDHKDIIATAISRLRSKIGYSTVALGLLPKKFRLGQLQKVYEAILGKPIDKRNFRKKMISLGLVTELGEVDRTGSFRPARLYKFKTSKPVIFD